MSAVGRLSAAAGTVGPHMLGARLASLAVQPVYTVKAMGTIHFWCAHDPNINPIRNAVGQHLRMIMAPS